MLSVDFRRGALTLYIHILPLGLLRSTAQAEGKSLIRY